MTTAGQRAVRHTQSIAILSFIDLLRERRGKLLELIRVDVFRNRICMCTADFLNNTNRAVRGGIEQDCSYNHC